MGCTKCEMVKTVQRVAKSNKDKQTKVALSSRVVFERMDKLSKFSKPIGALKQHSNEKITQKSFVVQTKGTGNSLARYKYYFGEQLKLKMQPFSNIIEYDKIREQLNNIDDKLWTAKREYERSMLATDPEEEFVRLCK